MKRWVLFTTVALSGWNACALAEEPARPASLAVEARQRLVELQVHLIERLCDDSPRHDTNTVRRVLDPAELKPFLQTATADSKGKIIAKPTIRTVLGKEGSFRNGSEFVLKVPNAKPGESPTEEKMFFGTALEATVTMPKPERLSVTFRFEHSERIDTSINAIPQKRTRTVQTRTDLQNGQTMVLDGLVSHRSITTVTRNPVLGEIPIVGDKLFAHRRTEIQSIEMVVLVTATLVEEPAK